MPNATERKAWFREWLAIRAREQTNGDHNWFDNKMRFEDDCIADLAIRIPTFLNENEGNQWHEEQVEIQSLFQLTNPSLIQHLWDRCNINDDRLHDFSEKMAEGNAGENTRTHRPRAALGKYKDFLLSLLQNEQIAISAQIALPILTH